MLFTQLSRRLDKEVYAFEQDRAEYIDPEEYSVLFSVVATIGALFLSTCDKYHEYGSVMEGIAARVVGLLSKPNVEGETSFVDMVIDMLRVHVAIIKSTLL